MKTVYIADDGTVFDDAWDCEDYEWRLKHPKINEIKFYDVKGNELFDRISERTYNYAETIIVPDDEAAEQLRELGDYAGFISYQDITSAGTWIFLNNNFWDSGYKRISE